MALVNCQNCRKTLRVPDGRGRVTCPRHQGGCGARFFHPYLSRTSTPVRCALTGRHMIVFFDWHLEQGQFVFDRSMATDAPDHDGKDYLGGDVGDLPARWFDWSLFTCACCGYHARTAGHHIFRCGHCKEIVCQSRSGNRTTPEHGPCRWLVCHAGCGSEGPVDGNFLSLTATVGERIPTELL